MITAQTKKVTIQDIANHAQVSPSTVSRVLNNGTLVTEAKRNAVLQAIEELDYRPNVFAQSLAKGQSKTIGILTQNLSGNLYDSILRGILEGIEGSGYFPLFTDGYWQMEKEANAIQTLLERQVAGLIVLGGCTPSETYQQIARQCPLILIGRNIPTLESQCLRLDNFEGGYRATQFLIEMGHTHIVHITGLLSHEDAFERKEGYLQALRDAQIEPDPGLIIEGDFLESSGLLAVEMLFANRRHFSAVFASNDQVAYGVRLALYRRGIRVPDDVSLIGFDDQRPSAYMTPPLTTIRQPSDKMGHLAAEAMLGLLNDDPMPLSPLPIEIVVRESVARYR